MPRYQVSPPQAALSIEGVQYTANEDGTFDLPMSEAIPAAIRAHGLSCTKVADLDQEMDYVSLAEAAKAKDEEIARLKAALAAAEGRELRPGTRAAAPRQPAAGGAHTETPSGAGKPPAAPQTMEKDGAAKTGTTGSGPTPGADSAPAAKVGG